MRTLLVALAAAGTLALATPALAGHGQSAAAPVVYYSPYYGNGNVLPAITQALGFNRGWYGQPIYNGHPGLHRGRCDHPGLHRGHYKKHRRHAARSHRPGYWFPRDRWNRHHDDRRFGGFYGWGHRSGHSQHARHDRRWDKDFRKHRKHDGDWKHDRRHDGGHDGKRHHRRHRGR